MPVAGLIRHGAGELAGVFDVDEYRLPNVFMVEAVGTQQCRQWFGDLEDVPFDVLVNQGLRLTLGKNATLVDDDDVITQAEHGQIDPDQQVNKDIFATTWKKKIFARTPSQARYFEMMRDNEVVFGLGPAGTGKTYMAVAWAVDCLKKRQVERIILSRPAVEAGERLGFLPGDMKEKVDPYLRPLYDALYDMMPADKVDRMIASNEIEIAPLAFMRGRTLSDAFVIIDEAQNTTPVQMKMVLTRLGQGSRMVITGDLSQIDLPSGQASGLSDAVSRLGKVRGIDIIRFSGEDVVRHPVVARILKAYEKSQT